MLRRKKDSAIEAVLRHEKRYQAHIEGQRDRAVQTCVRLEQELAEAKRENELLRNIIEGLRMRNYELLKESDGYAEVFGLPRYTMEPGIPEDLTVEVSDEELERLRERYGITQNGEE